MSVEDRFCQRSGLKEREAEDNRIRCNRKQCRMDICCDDHVVDKDGINAHANHDKKALERQSKQPFEIVRADAAPLPVAHRGYRYGSDTHGAINLNHASVQDDRNEDRHDLET